MNALVIEASFLTMVLKSPMKTPDYLGCRSFGMVGLQSEYQAHELPFPKPKA